MDVRSGILIVIALLFTFFCNVYDDARLSVLAFRVGAIDVPKR